MSSLPRRPNANRYFVYEPVPCGPAPQALPLPAAPPSSFFTFCFTGDSSDGVLRQTLFTWSGVGFRVRVRGRVRVRVRVKG